ncbi:ABC transporter ATP-binding protein [Gordonia jinhuaensis]|uniref:Tetronasin ABC transporter ATP-binding protein n=1 Tax=Gordonia jinhuaensis TaxID=1517702 RepID=A0A916TDU7_9ACTN|nr:ABC transporter ATP-binding protein [Gordonia jinhuaensis]GGB39839.1 tetronasin ABC transporter ATP-binding protein [Gordonia jinhuaensis]
MTSSEESTTSDELVIDVNGLRKSFGKFQALNGVDLHVARGQVHGFLGPNGAGKSTTIRVLLGLLHADAGDIRLLGGDPWRDIVTLHRRLAYVPGDVSLWPNMTGGEAIDLLGSMRGGLDEQRRADLVERFELDTTKRGRQYSKGNRQKVAIVAAFSSDVELLILDEPTSGLDPLMENVFQEVVGEAKARGTTALLSSHIMSEVETLADRVSIIRTGEIVQTGTLAQLRGHTRTSIHATLREMPGESTSTVLHDVTIDGNRLTATVESDHIGDAMTELTPCGIEALTVEPPSLESLFLRLYDDDETSTGAHH